MIVNKYQGNGGGGGYTLPTATASRLGGVKIGEGIGVQNDGTISVSGGSVDSGAVMTIVDGALSGYTEELKDGNPIVGMARQLYSPDGVDSTGCYAYRTTAGDEDVETGDARLLKIEGNATFPEQKFNPSGNLIRNDEVVEGFEMEFAWGDTTSWVDFDPTGKNDDYWKSANIQSERAIKAAGQTTIYYNYRETENGTYYGSNFNIALNNGAITSTAFYGESGNTHYWKVNNGISGTAVYDGTYLVVTITGSTNAVYHLTYFSNNCSNLQVLTGTVIPFDIPIGASSYSYDASTTAWTPSLPQSISSMTLNSETYVPEDGDEIGIYCQVYADEPASYPVPTSFVALGLNSFTSSGNVLISEAQGDMVEYDSNEPDGHYRIYNGVSENTYFVRAVPGLSDGYIVHSPNGHLPYRAGVATDNNFDSETEFEFGTTVQLSASTTYVVYPTNEMPYIVFSIDPEYIEDVCIHPRWSGKMDDAFEEYSESQINFDRIFIDDMKLVSLGDVRNVFDIENQKFIHNIAIDDYDETLIQDLVDEGKVLGEDFMVDDNYVYHVLDEPDEEYFADTIGDFSGDYYANDFSVEYFTMIGDSDADTLLTMPVYAETFYITNLVDKLRRMKMEFKHLDDLNAEGETGITYEYNGKLMMWNPNSGYVGEWLRTLDVVDVDEGTGFIYSNIPNGQKLFELKYRYGGDWRYVVYSGGTLYLTETAGTVVCAVTVGNSFQFKTSQYNYNVYGLYENGWIGFRKSNYVDFQNIWSGDVSTGHYELIDKNNYPYLGLPTDTAIGIPKFNGRGQVVRNAGGVSTKDIQFNTDASQYGTTGKITFYTNGTNNGPSRIFAPTAGGTAGQVLTSAGAGSEPQWATIIKAIKITSDEYEALVIKDPNTLYLIVDE